MAPLEHRSTQPQALWPARPAFTLTLTPGSAAVSVEMKIPGAPKKLRAQFCVLKPKVRPAEPVTMGFLVVLLVFSLLFLIILALPLP